MKLEIEKSRLVLYFRAALSLAVLLGIFWLGTHRGLYRAYFADMTFAIFTSCFFVALLRIRFRLTEVLGAVAFGLVLLLADVRILGYAASWESALSLLGLAALGLLTFRVIWWEGQQRRLAVFTLVPLLLLHSAGWFNFVVHSWTAKAQPAVLDLYLYSFDASMHVQLPFLVGQLFNRCIPFFLVCLIAYLILEVAIALTYAGCLVDDRKTALSAFAAFFIAGPIGVVCYNLFPALGPKYVFQAQFPWHPLTIEQVRHLKVEAVVLPGLRNAMPSLHAGWAYLICWYSRRLSLLERIMAAAILVFTLFATLGTGEHYFIDLVVALPFTVFVISLTTLLVHRARASFGMPLLVGLALTLAWFAALHFGLRTFWTNAAIPWAACLLTMAACFWMGARLAAEESKTPVEKSWPENDVRTSPLADHKGSSVAG